MDSFDCFADESVSLREGIDLEDLRDPNRGALFEVDTSDVKPESDWSNQYFPGEEVFKNLLKVDEETADICDKEGLDAFEAMMKTMEDITEEKDGGVWKRQLKPGAGPLAPHGSLVRIHYNAYQEMEAEPFDSTRLRQEVEKFRLGITGNVMGLHVAVASMKRGERAYFIFKPDYFYGEHGCPPRIPPDCTVLFDIELLSFVEREGVDDYEQMTEEEKRQVTFAFVSKVSKAEREEGNQQFNGRMYNKAWGKYKKAARVLEDYRLKNEEEQIEQQKLLVRVYMNMALCCSKLKNNGMTITYCNKVLAVDPRNVKAIYHKGQALHFMSEFDEARKFYLKAQRLDGANRDIAKALKRLDQDIKKFAIQSENYKKMCARMFKASVASGGSKTASDSPQNQTEEDSDVFEGCSAGFRATVTEKLEEFSKNPDIVQLPFPEQSLTPGEIACIVDVAEQMGMMVQRRGTGSACQMFIMKTKKQIQFD